MVSDPQFMHQRRVAGALAGIRDRWQKFPRPMLYLEDADGKMIDLDSQRQAEIVVRKADAISERTP